MDEKIKNNLKSEARWLRLVFMALFVFVGSLVTGLIVILAIAQALYGFFKGEPNDRLLLFSGSLNQFAFQIAQYLTYNADEKPYPFTDWPGSASSETAVNHSE